MAKAFRHISLSISLIHEYSSLSLNELRNKSKDDINYALAACVHAAKEGLGITPFDEQLEAAHRLYNGNIIQMATGEGKTLSAVFAAYLLKCENRTTHILTFNDYLAKRDCKWMKPIYDLLGVTVNYITEETETHSRKELYTSDVVYSTAKECGFDYLRDFITDRFDNIIQNKLDCVIVDEADSILIDEARIPLVIAGSFAAQPDKKLPEIYSFIRTLDDNDYSISVENRSVFLTDIGVHKAEVFLDIENLYDEENSNELAVINDCLKAEFYLYENKDYIVKNDEILIIDEFTGRVAKGRHYPGSLQSAVETKHGVRVTERGITMGTIPLQFFIRQYDFIAGMTGTAKSAAEEFELLYGLQMAEISTHLPCTRIDHPTEVYFDDKTKWHNIVKTITEAHRKGQPVLVGTSSISESENLAVYLLKHDVKAQVLNAKNDEMEAEIIKNAGKLGAVTISTNMAGRGVDILLGGVGGETRNDVIKSGGLLVLSTQMHESSRINNQLRGRAGRQGDIGESRVFVSLEDDIMEKYQLKKLIPKSHYPAYTKDKITDKLVLREVERIQRISEGDMLDERKNLLKFTAITEKHRNTIFGTRLKYLKNEIEPTIWQDNDIEAYSSAVSRFTEKAVQDLQCELILNVINECWSEYLSFIEELRSGIHLTSVGGKNPTEEFNISSENYFQDMEEQVTELMLQNLYKLNECKNIEKFIIEKPLSIYTFLIDEKVEDLVKKPLLANLLTTEDEAENDNKQTAVNKSLFSRLFKK